MAKTIFITGGARSGKSRFAEELAQQFGAPLCYLATAQALDDEMTERVKRHRLRRGDAWQTIEEPLHLSHALARCDGTGKAVLVDCITLWLSNLLFHYEERDEDAEACIMEDVRRLTATLREMRTPVIVVSNEVGQGIVPENRLARRFRDIAGQTNQLLAAMADEVYVAISGIPLKLK
ncbi:bifunctional adenosylcobinamide kinase/adenosylcobinamide-phosphate guanylyltransferase [Oryzomonas japonica]|uniref:Adenosylcobinamide kinase n=1 Tax=Oryzomonas japonica TaxID=2603858 RepID=A0A7J4ZSL3_9BACT|nr:bifunctional adenosylcobinamide kinase/adenosylcobinamide-phosphate guanylyltransferase [Oryzomonas japonica]KAB0666071.1 bifunctional adenosylcobinamide kinase/adenosylcobinamide-phosphate guanylyltransferase [Oryzomonas japonica]